MTKHTPYAPHPARPQVMQLNRHYLRPVEPATCPYEPAQCQQLHEYEALLLQQHEQEELLVEREAAALEALEAEEQRGALITDAEVRKEFDKAAIADEWEDLQRQMTKQG